MQFILCNEKKKNTAVVQARQTRFESKFAFAKSKPFVWRTRTLFFWATCGSNCAKRLHNSGMGEGEGEKGG